MRPSPHSGTLSQCSSVCKSRDKPRSNLCVPLTTRAAAFTTRCSLSEVFHFRNESMYLIPNVNVRRRMYVWPSATNPCINFSVFWCWYVMSHCDLDLWPVDLESLWYIKRHVIKVCTKFEQNQAIPAELLIILRIFAHVMSRFDPTLWPRDVELLQHFGCQGPIFETSWDFRKIFLLFVVRFS